MNAEELFQMVDEERRVRGWGRALRSVVARWYSERPAEEVAADILKCPRYKGYTHRDLLRLCHARPATPAHNALFQWVSDGRIGHLATPEVVFGELRQVYAVELLKNTADEQEALRLIEQYQLTYEMIPAEWRNSAAICESLIEGMTTANIARNLTVLADTGVLAEESAATALVVARLMDRRRLASARLDRQTLSRIRAEYARHPKALGVVLQALDSALEAVV
jgi:60 kDa SS-A/Ro ribonucleoprotein